MPLAAAAAILALQAQTGQPASEFGGVVVKELLDNALDAAEKGDEALFVEIVTRTEGEITFVTVTKNGAGIGASRGTRSDCEYDQP